MPAELLTFYDDATGERAGLTAAEIGAWSAATAALLTEGCGLKPGSRAAVLLPPHWQTAAVLLGAWAAGIEVSFRDWATAGLRPAGDPLDATFVELRRIGSWLDDVPGGRHQFALPLTPLTDRAPPATASPGMPPPQTPRIPDGYRDYTTEIRPYLGAAPPATTIRAGDAATADGTTFASYEAIAADLAKAQRITKGDRVLIDAAQHEQPLFWLLAPLTAGASIVLCANLDHTRLPARVTDEQVTHVLAGD
jgi:uncharacterized protein (TIGR03089 family)